MDLPQPVLVQGVTFVVAALTGVAAGLMADAHRALSRAVRLPRYGRHALDVLLVCTLTPLVAVGLLAANWGQLRAYPLAALLAGFGLYLLLGSPFLLPVLSWMALALARTLGAAARFVLRPPRRLLRLARDWRIRRPPEGGEGTTPPAAG